MSRVRDLAGVLPSGDEVQPAVKHAFAGVRGREPEPLLTIDVLNLSAYPVTVTSVGFSNGKWQMLMFRTVRGEELPHRLEARESFSVYCNTSSFQDPRFAEMRWGFAKTACGVTAKSECISNKIQAFEAATQEG